MTKKYIAVEKKEDCNRLEECGVQCLALDGQPCPGPDHPDCPLDEQEDFKESFVVGTLEAEMGLYKKQLAEKDKEIEELVKAEEESCLEKNLTIEDLEKQLEEERGNVQTWKKNYNVSRDTHVEDRKIYEADLKKERANVLKLEKEVKDYEEDLSQKDQALESLEEKVKELGKEGLKHLAYISKIRNTLEYIHKHHEDVLPVINSMNNFLKSPDKPEEEEPKKQTCPKCGRETNYPEGWEPFECPCGELLDKEEPKEPEEEEPDYDGDHDPEPNDIIIYDDRPCPQCAGTRWNVPAEGEKWSCDSCGWESDELPPIKPEEKEPKEPEKVMAYSPLMVHPTDASKDPPFSSETADAKEPVEEEEKSFCVGCGGYVLEEGHIPCTLYEGYSPRQIRKIMGPKLTDEQVKKILDWYGPDKQLQRNKSKDPEPKKGEKKGWLPADDKLIIHDKGGG